MTVESNNPNNTAHLSQNPLFLVICLNLLLALLVLAKDLLLAGYLGTSLVADAFWLAFFIPDAIGSNWLALSLATACVPAFTRLSAPNRTTAAKAFAGQLLIWCSGLAALLWVVRTPLLSLIGGGLDSETLLLADALLIRMLPVVLVYPLVSLLCSWLQAARRFALAAVAPLLQNGFWLLALLVVGKLGLTAQAGVGWLALALPTAAMATFCLLLLGVRQTGNNPAVVGTDRQSEFANNIRRRLFPMLLLALAAQAMLFGERFWAATCGPGTVAALNYAYRLAQFPLWTFVAAVAMVTLPALTEQAENQRPLAERSINLVLLIAVPCSLALSLLAKPIVSILMQRGSFDGRSVLITAAILQSYALAIVPLAIAVMAQRVFIARGEMRPPLIGAGLAASVTFLADGCLVTRIGPAGLGHGATLGAVVQAAWLLWRLQQAGIPALSRLRHSVPQLALSHLPLGAVLVVARQVWPLVTDKSTAVLISYLLLSGLAAGSAWLVGLSKEIVISKMEGCAGRLRLGQLRL